MKTKTFKLISILFLFIFIINNSIVLIEAAEIDPKIEAAIKAAIEKRIQEVENQAKINAISTSATDTKTSTTSVTGCKNGELFNSATGKPCTSTTINTDTTKPTTSVVTPKSTTLLKNMLKPGSNGEEVKLLQTKLKEKGYFVGDTTLKFGNITEAAVKKFQKANKLSADGIVGLKTIELLNK